MVRYKSCLAAVITLFAALVVSQSQAEIYKFTGTLPGQGDPDLVFVRGDLGTGVNPGDSWTVIVDVVDTTGSEVIAGWYGFAGAIESAQITFSSGYSATLSNFVNQGDFNDVDVFNNVDLDDPFKPFDSVAASMRNDGVDLLAQVANESDLNSIMDSTVLPTFPTEFGQDVTVSGITGIVLDFRTPGGGVVSYDSLTNGYFQVVPEPSTIMLWTLAAGLGCVLWRRRRAK